MPKLSALVKASFKLVQTFHRFKGKCKQTQRKDKVLECLHKVLDKVLEEKAEEIAEWWVGSVVAPRPVSTQPTAF